MKIKLFICLCFLAVSLNAWESNFELSEEAQKKADFYNKFARAFALENENPEEALVLLKDLLNQAPDDKILIQEYCYLALDNYTNDFEFCKNTVKNIKEKTWQHHTLLGDYYLREGSLSNALSEYEQALKMNPESLELSFHYAGILASIDQAAAVTYLKKLAKDYPQTENLITLKIADIYLKSGDNAKAISTLKNTLITTNSKVEIYTALAKIYEVKQDKQALYQIYQDMEKDGLADTKILETLIKIAFSNKDEDNGHKYLQKLIKLDPQNDYAAFVFALLEEKQGRYEQALKYLQNSREFENNPNRQIKAGYYLSMLGKQEELLALMESNYKRFPSNGEIAYYYALALIDSQKYDEAEKVFEKFLEKAPKNTLILFNYATLLYQQKKYNKMENTLREIIEIVPEHDEALNFLGYFLIDRNKTPKSLEEGRELVLRALAVSPQEVAYRDSIAWYYFRTGNYGEAQKIISALPETEDEEIYFHKAEIAAALKDFNTAVTNYEQALKMNPKNKEAKRGLKKAKRKISK